MMIHVKQLIGYAPDASELVIDVRVSAGISPDAAAEIDADDGSSNSQYFIVYAPLFENAQNKGTIYFNDTLLFQNWALRKQDGTVSQQISTINSYVNFPDEKINKITIRTAESGKVIAANSKINIKILR